MEVPSLCWIGIAGFIFLFWLFISWPELFDFLDFLSKREESPEVDWDEYSSVKKKE